MFRSLMAVELIVHDLERCTAFYRDVLGLELSQADDDGAMFKLDNVYFFLQEANSVAKMMSDEPVAVAAADAGARVLLAAGVEDVDAAYAALSAKGVQFLRPPTDQPWGLRTAFFADPEGNVWEINQPVEQKPA